MPAQNPLVSLIIVNRNGMRWLAALLDSVRAQDYRPVELILVDNMSTDGSPEYVRAQYPDVQVIDPRENMGFGKAANLGARAACGAFLIFLNEDMKLHPGMISRLSQRFAREPDGVGIVAAREVSYDDAGVTHNRGWMLDRRGFTTPNLDAGRAERGEFFYAPGAPCFITRACFEAVGGFEDYYFLYFEDVDLSWKARLLGYRIVFCEDAVIHHAGGGTTNRRSALTSVLMERNKLASMLKNCQGRNVLRLFIPTLQYVLVTGALNAGRQRSWGPLRNAAHAVAGLARMLPKVLAQRRVLQRRRRVPDGPVLALLSHELSVDSLRSLAGRAVRGVTRNFVKNGLSTYGTTSSVR